MEKFNIKIADTVFSLSTNYDNTLKMCRDYLTEENGEKITISQQDIDYERELSVLDAKRENTPVYNFSDGYLETTAVYRKIANYFSYHDGSVFHGALIELDGDGYLFTANSGTGKTTHIKNWIKAFKNTKIINGDKPIIRVIGDEVFAYGTPWSGKEGYNLNERVKLKAIIILKRDLQNHIETTPPNNAINAILGQTYRATDPMGMQRTLDFAIKLTLGVATYTLGCNMDVESATVAYNGINKK